MEHLLFAVALQCTLAAALQVSVPTQRRADKPAPLLLFEQARDMISAEFSVRSYGPNSAPNRFRSIVQGGQVLFFIDGTENGITGYFEDGRPVRDLQEGVLLRSDGIWQKYEKGLSAEARLGSGLDRPGVLDFRCVGMTPTAECLMAAPLEAIGQTRHAPPEHVEYTASVDEDGLQVVEAKVRDSPWSTVWYIDPEQGWNAVRVDDLHEGQVARSVFTDYRCYNGTWVPVKSAYADGLGNVHGVDEIDYSKVNTPDIPAELTPNHIGIWAGTPVHVQDQAGSRQMMWSGERLLTLDEYRELSRRGELQRDPRVVEAFRQAEQRARAATAPAPPMGARGATTAPGSRPAATFAQREQLLDQRIDKALIPELDEWDKYVLEFIRRYHLDDEQAQQCRKILTEAKERRDGYLSRKRDDIRKLKGGKYNTEGDMKLAEEKLNVLLKPIERTFERMKARLLKVPTRKQLEDYGTP